ncbi:hypothetical protein THASP1DRAFT_27985 [Thamnocephalis sphaerospora]|uniref:Uncharacterized protein n=1 Tax=Thamnocephalis sphaerospora TaxID=78915 RepID=A0A4P9XVF0_9FUNG|nr:hypothetical protein THASP1DRAFT_27985 [Thamnocephalis sphaerospora]|eukprot:RKP10255.1 hypothetical protein THASP1DRAFT_27985 [Thamnocephalis sphaerospora]
MVMHDHSLTEAHCANGTAASAFKRLTDNATEGVHSALEVAGTSRQHGQRPLQTNLPHGQRSVFRTTSIDTAAPRRLEESWQREWQNSGDTATAQPGACTTTLDELDDDYSEAWSDEAMTRAYLAQHAVPHGSTVEWGESAYPAVEEDAVLAQAWDATGGVDRPMGNGWDSTWSASMAHRPFPANEYGADWAQNFRSGSAASDWSAEFANHPVQTHAPSRLHTTQATELSAAERLIMDARAGLDTRRWSWRWEQLFGVRRHQQLQNRICADGRTEDCAQIPAKHSHVSAAPSLTWASASPAADANLEQAWLGTFERPPAAAA